MLTYFSEAWLPAVAHTHYGRTAPNDRHVAAAAVHVAPSTLVTWNLRDFDTVALRSVDVAVQSPDRFLCDPHDRHSELVVEASREAQANLSRSAPTWDDDRDVLFRSGLRRFVGRLGRR